MNDFDRTAERRLLRDLDVLGRIQQDDHVPAAKRVEEKIGPQLFAVVTGLWLAPGHVLSRTGRVA